MVHPTSPVVDTSRATVIQMVMENILYRNCQGYFSNGIMEKMEKSMKRFSFGLILTAQLPGDSWCSCVAVTSLAFDNKEREKNPGRKKI
ncbi:MAG: hypothetical protein HQL76_10925 [Magnetococcales bacterium]|nr:hypothetical protein [Magnetococcales bacterium]